MIPQRLHLKQQQKIRGKLALSLGVLKQISIDFGKCSVSLWMDCDNKFVARTLTIFSSQKDLHHILKMKYLN